MATLNKRTRPVKCLPETHSELQGGRSDDALVVVEALREAIERCRENMTSGLELVVPNSYYSPEKYHCYELRDALYRALQDEGREKPKSLANLIFSREVTRAFDGDLKQPLHELAYDLKNKVHDYRVSNRERV